MEKIKRLLEKNELFVNVEKEGMDHILSYSKSRLKTYQAGQMIFNQDDKPNKFYAIIRGRVALVKHISLGKKNILYELREGSIFGEDFLIHKRDHYWYDAEAVVDCDLLEISANFFSEIYEGRCSSSQQLLANLIGIITKKEEEILKKVYINSSSSLSTKISIWLMNNSDSNGVVKSPMDREELANYFGVARPSLSRSLMKMQEEGLIRVKKDIFLILDPEKIKEISE